MFKWAVSSKSKFLLLTVALMAGTGAVLLASVILGERRAASSGSWRIPQSWPKMTSSEQLWAGRPETGEGTWQFTPGHVENWVSVYGTNRSFESVASYFLKELPEAGWKQAGENSYRYAREMPGERAPARLRIVQLPGAEPDFLAISVNEWGSEYKTVFMIDISRAMAK